MKSLPVIVILFTLFATGCGPVAQADPTPQPVEWLDSHCSSGIIVNEPAVDFPDLDDLEVKEDVTAEETELEEPPTLYAERTGICHLGLDWGSATMTINYSDSERGLAFDFPYSPTWNRAPTPYNEIRYEILPGTPYETLRFGPIGTMNGCSLPQYYYVKFLPVGNTKTGISKDPVYKTIGAYEVVEYTTLGISDQRPAIKVQGSQYAYEFYAYSGTDDEMEVLELIVETLLLL